MSVGKRLQSLRREHNMSQEVLAEKIGVTRQTISKWELGQSEPDLSSLLRLSVIFGVTTDNLLGSPNLPATEAVPPTPVPEEKSRRPFRQTAYFLFLIAALCMSGTIFLYLVEERINTSILYYNAREFLPVLGVLFSVWGTELLCTREKLIWKLLWSAWIVVGGAGLFIILAAYPPQDGRDIFISHLMHSTVYWVSSVLCGLVLAATNIFVNQRRKKQKGTASSNRKVVDHDA